MIGFFKEKDFNIMPYHFGEVEEEVWCEDGSSFERLGAAAETVISAAIRLDVVGRSGGIGNGPHFGDARRYF